MCCTYTCIKTDNLQSLIYSPIYSNITLFYFFFQCHSCLSLLKVGNEDVEWGEQDLCFSAIFYNQVF